MKAVAIIIVCTLSSVLAGCGSDEPTKQTQDGTSQEQTDSVVGEVCEPDGTGLTCDSLEPMAAAPEGAAPNSSADYTVQDYLMYMITDIDEMWTTWFTTNGFSEPMVGYEIINPGETYTSQCAIGGQNVFDDAYPNAFYCPPDVLVGGDGVSYQGVMVLPETTFQKMWQGDVLGSASNTVGDFAAAIIVAHEFGHHVQDEMLIQAQAAYPDQQLGEPNGANNELIADCFAGVWMASAYYDNLMIDTDYEEALSALYAIGDKGESDDPHGTPEQRVEAITSGYNSIDPMGCVNAYWK